MFKPAGYDLSWYNLLKVKGHVDTDLVCVFQPKVQVLDNWGWCTGDCEGVGKGCYNKDGPILVQGCNNSADDNKPVQNRWVEFSNIIVVAP